MPLPAFTFYGADTFRLLPDRPVRRAREVHTLSQRWQVPARDSFTLGAAPPDWPHMRIVGIEPETEIDDMAYDLRLDCEGILDESPYIELSRDEECPEEGWDTVSLTVYTRTPRDARWRKGSQVQLDPLTGVTAAASTDLLTGTAHGLVTGQLAYLDHGGGFGGLISGGGYYVYRVSADTLRLCLSNANALLAGASTLGDAIAITASQSTDTFAATAHGLNDGDVVTLPSLTGGAGLVAALQPYFVVNASTDAFQLSLTADGEVVNFATNVIAGTVRRGTYIDISSDGVDGVLRAVVVGFENLYITDRRVRAARAAGYYELDLQLKGLNGSEGEVKLIKRRIATTAQTATDEKFPAILITPVWAGIPPRLIGTSMIGPPSIPGDFPLEADMPQIAVTDTCIINTPPPTWLVPGNWIPDNAPAVGFQVISGGSYFTTHWPAGWKVLSLQSEQIPGKELHLIQLTLGNQVATTPRTPPPEV